MINLISTSDKLQVVTSGTADIDVMASFMDATTASGIITPSTMKPGNQRSAITTAATTDIISAPGANVARNVKEISIRNKHASAANNITVQQVNAAGTAEKIKLSLASGESLIFTEGDGWTAYDAAGAKKNISLVGRHLLNTVLIAGTSFVTGPSTTKIGVRLVGGGAGGGGCTSVAAAGAGAGGGGAGGYAEKFFTVTPNTTYTYAIGAAGAGSSGAAGGNGGNTTFAVGATTVTAFGGTGGPQAVTGTAVKSYAGGAGGVVSTNGDLNSGGEPGDYGVCILIAGPIVASGSGGPSPFGSGGIGIIAAGNGVNALGFGAGGGGSATGASAARTGGNGTAGCIIVDEYA